jgi:hypothetical protein
MSSYGNENGNRVGAGTSGGQEQKQEQEQEQEQEQKQQFVSPSLCIPRTHANIRRERIFAVLRSLNLGWVGRIDIVPKRNDDGTEFVRVFVHFTKWFNNHQTRQFLERLDLDGHARIVYDEPWYWKVTKSTMSAPEEFKPKEPRAEVQSRYPKPRIDFTASVAKDVETSAGVSTAASTAAVQRIVPVQVTRHVTRHTRSVGGIRVEVGSGGDDEKTKQYWKEQAEISSMKKFVQPFFEKLSPTPKLGDSVSPLVQGKTLSVKLLFE